MKFMENPKWYWLRWIGIIPSAIVMSCIVYLIILYINRFYSDPESWNMLYVAPLIASFGSGVGFIGAAKYIAPSYKDRVSIMLLMLILVCTGFELFLVIENQDYFHFSKYVLSALGAILGHFIYKEETT